MQVFCIQFYLGTTRLQLEHKGDRQHHYTNFANVIVSFGFVVIPVIGWLLDHKGYGITLGTINCIGVSVSVLQAIPSLRLQVGLQCTPLPPSPHPATHPPASCLWAPSIASGSSFHSLLQAIPSLRLQVGLHCHWPYSVGLLRPFLLMHPPPPTPHPKASAPSRPGCILHWVQEGVHEWLLLTIGMHACMA